MKKFGILMLTLVFLMGMTTSVMAKDVERTENYVEVETVNETQEIKRAKLSEDKFLFNDEDVYITTFKVEDENYFKISDLAALLEDTDKKFNVEFNEENLVVIITKGENYKKIQTDLKEQELGETDAYQGLHKLYINDGQEMKKLEIKSYNILGNNYYRLRDLGKELGFGAAYNFKKSLVMLDTRVKELEDIKVDLQVEDQIDEVNINKESLAFFQELESKYGIGMGLNVIGENWCPACRRLYKEYEEKDIKYNDIGVDNNIFTQELLAKIQKTNENTIPCIFNLLKVEGDNDSILLHWEYKGELGKVRINRVLDGYNFTDVD